MGTISAAQNTGGVLGWFSGHWIMITVVILVLAMLIGYKLVLRLLGVVIIPEDSLGVVDKKFVLFGSHRALPDGKIIALHGEAGVQADTLAPGLHWGYWPWQYGIETVKFVTIPQGQIGVVESRDGIPLSGGRILGKRVDCDSFQNARAFIENGGERGPQITVVPPGTYRINTGVFSISYENVTEIEDNMVGIVTTKEGKPLPSGDIAGGEISGHNMFQDGEAFVANGGYKGLQVQPILAGRYFINPMFATVEIKEMTTVPIANVGVAIAYVGEPGVDVTGESFKHGNLVAKGQKGVWVEPLDPGKYPINPYTHRVEIVPTANVVLNWATGKTEAHNLDKNLSTITVRSSDGFTFNLDVSQIIHIPRSDAPKVIARFGTVANLVTQVLEPTIGNYFRNSAQKSDVIQFLSERSARQEDACRNIEKALSEYNIGAVNTLIGDIVPPAQLMKTLTDRKIAEQEKITYGTQKQAEEVRKELAQAQAMADTQPQVVDAERKVSIAEFNKKTAITTAEGAGEATKIEAYAKAEAKVATGEADAKVITITGNAEAIKTKAVGEAEASVIKMKTEAMDQDKYAAVEVARALASSGFKLVPDVVAGGSGDGSGTLVNVLLASLVKDHVQKPGQPQA